MSDLTTTAWIGFLDRFRTPLLSHLLLDAIYFCFLFIFNSAYVHAFFSNMTNFSACLASCGSIPFS